MKDAPPLQKITWLDHYGVEGDWQACEDVEIKRYELETVGYIIKENDEYICIAQTFGGFEGESVNTGRMFILKADVLKRKKLGEKR